MMRKLAAIAIVALPCTAGCSSSASDSADPLPTASLDWSTGCRGFDDASRAEFGNLINSAPATYRSFSKALTETVSGVAPSQVEHVQRVIDASSAMADMQEMYPNPPDPNEAELMKIRDEFVDSIIAVNAECRAHGHPID